MAVIGTNHRLVPANHRRTVHLAARGKRPQGSAIAPLDAMELLVPSAEQNAVRRNRRRGKIRKVAFMEIPKLPSFRQVDAQKLVLEMTEVRAIIRERNRPRNVSPRFDFLDLLAIRQRNDVQRGIASAKSSLAPGNSGGTINVIAALEGPDGLARGGIHAMKLEIVAADQDVRRVPVLHPIGRANNLVAGIVFPNLFTRGSFQRVEGRVSRAEEHFSIEHKR